MRRIRQLLIQDKGFSLVEMVVASAILLFSISVIMNAFVTGNIINKRSSETAIAANLARKKLELVKNKGYANIIDEAEADVGSDYPGFKWTVSVSYVQKDESGTYIEAASDKGLKKVVVKVSWSGEGKNEVEVLGVVANANLYSVQGGISGYVYETGGSTPVDGATVATSDGLYSANTSSDGSYSIDNIIEGAYTFYASKSGYSTSSQAVTVTAGTVTSDVNFNIVDNPGAISGTILHVASTNTISGANIITSPGGYSATSDDGGNYTISGILSGDYTVTATADGYQYSRKYGITVIGGSTTADVGFELSPKEGDDTGTITGTIFSEDGSKIGGASVSTSPGGYSATTNNNPSDPAYGTYTIDDVIPDTYTITAQASGYVETQEAGHTVSAGGTVVADLTLKGAGGRIKGQVTNSAGNGVEGVRLSLSGTSLYALTDDDGYYTIESVPAGTYDLTGSTTSPSKSQTVSIEVYSELDTIQDFNTKNFS